MGVVERQLEKRASAGMVGREQELAFLLQLLEEEGPTVVCVYGPAGIGKSTLLAAFRLAARSHGKVVSLDCRDFEPTEVGFRRALATAAGDGLNADGAPTVLIIDTYELFRLSDTWLRQEFVPALPENVRVVIAGREPPMSGWWAAPGWHEAFRSLPLGPLDDDDAVRVLEAAGVAASSARRVNRVTRGHPLALTVAAAAAREQPDLALDDGAIPRAVEALTELFVGDLATEDRIAIEAASVVRRATRPLLTAMTSDASAFSRVAALPFVEPSSHGLVMHESVQYAVATQLRAADAPAHRGYRQIAWRQLRSELEAADPSALWRYTADLLFLIENPVVREAFFPTTAYLYSVEPAREPDLAAVCDIVQRHDSPGMVTIIEAWWQRAPDTLRVVRDRDGRVAGMSLVIDERRVTHAALDDDPVMHSFRRHLRHHPVPADQSVLILRRYLAAEEGEGPGDVQAAAWLDLKRTYIERRTELGRLYTVLADPEPFMPVFLEIGFSLVDDAVEIDGALYRPAFLDFGPNSVDGWLARLAAKELGLEEPRLLDPDTREVVVDDVPIPLTPLEYALLSYLSERPGKAVSRAVLLENVWGTRYEGGSNVVDVAVRALRRKLGSTAGRIQTVRGVGYRWDG